MAKQPKVSIIIPLWVVCDRFFQDLKKFDRLNYKNAEILVVADKKVDLPKLRKFEVKLILTGKKVSGPAEKRDIAINKAKGSICAFIDDDAYPDRDWLVNTLANFYHPKIAAVGGPGVTPKEDNYWEQITGLVYSSFFCGGFAQYRFVEGKKQFVDDYPAYNLLVKKSVLNKVGGYGNHFYGGEDTFLCLKIIKDGYEILYDPKVVVYHHRRPLFIPYLRQIGNIGKHRGYFAKKFPQTSRRPIYMFPTLLTLGFFTLLLLSFFNIVFLYIFICLLLFFVIVGSFSVVNRTNTINAFIASIGIILTHLVYGTNFVLGLFTNKLKR